jgi:site-specific DNA recombinase
VISTRPAYPAIVSEADYIAAQEASAPRGPVGPATRRYLLAGLLESAWSNGKPAYRCRHVYTSATRPEPDRPKNLYVRKDQILPHLAALAILHEPDKRTRAGQDQRGAQVTGHARAAELIDRLRVTGVTLIYDQATRTLRTNTMDALTVTVG